MNLLMFLLFHRLVISILCQSFSFDFGINEIRVYFDLNTDYNIAIKGGVDMVQEGNQQREMSTLKKTLDDIRTDRANGIPDYSIEEVEQILNKVIETTQNA